MQIPKDKIEKSNLRQGKVRICPEIVLNDNDPIRAIHSGKIMVRAWARSKKEKQKAYGQSFMLMVMETYWEHMHRDGFKRSIPFLFQKFKPVNLDEAVVGVASAIGAAASKLSVVTASYLLGNVYTAVLPELTRTSGGIFYTPPALTKRLIEIAEREGINWSEAKVIDPACGGGAFLAPVCLKKLEALKHQPADIIIQHIETHLTGWEIDPFGGWLSQLFVEVVLKDQLRNENRKLKQIVKIVDSLEMAAENVAGTFDLVIGNPPYGKLKLTEFIKRRFNESLYGHPNLYGLFTHLSLDLAKKNGVIALLTPTSFLAGEYFKNLRKYIRRTSTPIEMDFVSFRKGVFEDVLQETMLSVYRKSTANKAKDIVTTNELITSSADELKTRECGKVKLSEELTAPWLLPRDPKQTELIRIMATMSGRLTDWGYSVSTGPLVWNRHKSQLSNSKGDSKYPIVWAEAVTQDGRFILKAEKKNHKTYFRPKKGHDWLVTKKACIVLQRTTAKEQDKRLIAAAVPNDLIKTGVVIENHLNMILPKPESKTTVNAPILAAFLNSKIVNEAFRTISGSVAVSAYELEALPLPPTEQLESITKLLTQGATDEEIEGAIEALYCNGK
jgi:adenine-specific DNA-methyltransferase